MSDRPTTPDLEQVWEALTAVVGDGIIITDAATERPGPTIVYVNDAVVRTTGYLREELVGASPRRFQGPATDPAELRRIRDHLRRHEPVTAELTNHRKDGTQVIVELEITPLRDGDGTVTGFLAIQRDITERRMVDRRFRALVEHSAELISVSAPDGTVSYVSPSVERILGWRPDEFVGRAGAEFVHPDDAARLVAGLLAKSEREGSNPPVEFRFLAADGSWRWLEAVTTNLLDEPAVRGMVVNARDITERKQLEEQLRQAQKMDAIGRLAGGVAHDFNNLLQIIDGRTELALADLPADSPVRDHLLAVLAAGVQAAALTTQLLTISRQDMSSPRLVVLDDVVAEAAPLLGHVVGEGVALHVELDAADAHVVANPDQLTQVVVNLALNARDAMPDGGELTMRTERVRIDPATVQRRDLDAGAYVVLTVTDTGKGIEPDVLPHVFEPFFTTKQLTGGTGLGLPTVYGIVHQSGGTVDVSSSGPGGGTTFTVHLPEVSTP